MIPQVVASERGLMPKPPDLSGGVAGMRHGGINRECKRSGKARRSG